MIEHKYFESDKDLQLELAKLINEKKLIPIIGSGFTKGCRAKNGIVPSGKDMIQYMKGILSKKYNKDISSFADASFSKLCTGLINKQLIQKSLIIFQKILHKSK